MSVDPDRGASTDHDVVVIGGGPGGCSAGVFAAREGLDTVIFDRGRSSLKRCAFLENYPGFPAGIDVETFYELLHRHAERAGCEIVPDLVESLTRRADGPGFVVHPQDGDVVTARRVVAATRYDGEYMRGLDDDAAMFEDHGDQESFDRSYAARDGTTAVDGLYVVSPSEESQQVVVAAGRGARVAQRVIADTRLDDGWWEEPADDVDWVRREAELDEEYEQREAWIDWFEEAYAESAPVDPDSAQFRRVRETVVDSVRGSYLAPDEIESRTERGQAALASHLDADAVVEGCDQAELLAAIDDDLIAAHVDGDPATAEVSGGGE